MKRALVVAFMCGLAVSFGCQQTAQGESAVSDRQAAGAERGRTPEIAEPNAQGSAVAGSSASAARASSAAGLREADSSGKGPTVLLNYGQGTAEKNSIQSFMYFVPLISPVPVDRAVSADNNQEVSITSYERKITGRSFTVSCDFEMSGQGSIRYTLEPARVIAQRQQESKKPRGEPMANLLDYINFEGGGLGSIEVKGTMDRGVPTVTEVNLDFNGRGRRSPATIGLYDLKAKNGLYSYENRSSQVIARVNALTFKKSREPRMDITLDSITKKPGANGFFGHLKAAFANLFIKPVKVDPRGNQAMLDFGCALLEQKAAFTFPKADNLKAVSVFAVEANAQ